MSFYSHFVSHTLFPLHELLKGHGTARVKNALDQSQWFEPATLQECQNQGLVKLLRYANKNSPYYRALFNEYDIQIEDIYSIKELSALPFLTKDIIRRNKGIIKDNQSGKLIHYQTGGSSGEPLQFYVSKTRISHDVAAKWRATNWWGVDIGDKELVIWGSGIECGKQSLLRAWRDKAFRSYLVPARELSLERLDDIIQHIIDFKPRMLFGYPSILSHIAKRAVQQNVSCHQLGIQVAFVTSEVLDESQKQLIEKTFGCPVANGYGGRDAGFLAHQCPKGSMHITQEDVILEIIDENDRPVKPGEAGEIVVTHLQSYGFPFIRYRTGDLGRLSNRTCNCGRGLMILDDIIGRSSDLIYTQEGAVVHRAEIVNPIAKLSNIERFQFIQKKHDYSILKIKGQPLDESQQINLQKRFKDLLGSNTHVEILYVNDIQPERSGKFKFVISEIEND